MTVITFRHLKTIISNIRFLSTTSAAMGLKLGEVISKLNDFAPLQLAENWDNVGLLIEPFTPRNVTKILLTNDLTEAVMKEAIKTESDLIISYHPPIFSPLRRITQCNWKSRIVSMCLEHRIALYSPHTAWDAIDGGVNDWLAKSMPFTNIRPINELADQSKIGSGRFLDISLADGSDMSLHSAIDRVKKHIGITNVNVAIGCDSCLTSPIKTVALCAGSGNSVLKSVKADLYITGEMSHHDVLDAVHRNTSVILCNHSNSERGFLHEFKPQLETLLGDVSITVSAVDADPLEIR